MASAGLEALLHPFAVPLHPAKAGDIVTGSVTNPKVRQPEFVVVWEFQVKAGKGDEFERIYGPDGEWAKFFRRGEGYLRTELIRDLEAEGRYLTIDFWVSRETYLRFSTENGAEYRAIDEKCESLTEAEALLGTFERFA